MQLCCGLCLPCHRLLCADHCCDVVVVVVVFLRKKNKGSRKIILVCRHWIRTKLNFGQQPQFKSFTFSSALVPHSRSLASCGTSCRGQSRRRTQQRPPRGVPTMAPESPHPVTPHDVNLPMQATHPSFFWLTPVNLWIHPPQ